MRSSECMLGVLAAFWVAACGGDGGDEFVTAVDSAGVRVTTITTPLESFEPYVLVASEPALSIGAADEEGPELFGRVGNAWGLPDGSVLVVDQLAHEVRHFDASGSFIGSFGREGQGPGEFGGFERILYADMDSVWVSDARNRRISVFGLGGEYARMFRMDTGTGQAGPIARLAGGGLAGVTPVIVTGGARGEITRNDQALLMFSDDGEDPDTAAVLPGLEWITLDITMPMIFSRQLVLGSVDDRIVGGPNDRFELRWWSGDGALTAITRFTSADVPVSEEEVASMVEELTGPAGGLANLQPGQREYFELPPPPVRPAFNKILSDGEGRLWVGVFEPEPRPATHWWVFASDDAAPLGYVDTPEDFTVYHVDGYGILGVGTDELGVQYLRRYALTEPE